MSSTKSIKIRNLSYFNGRKIQELQKPKSYQPNEPYMFYGLWDRVFKDFYVPKPLLLPLILSAVSTLIQMQSGCECSPSTSLPLAASLVANKVPKTHTEHIYSCRDLRQKQLVALWKGNHSCVIIDTIFLHEMDLHIPKMVTGFRDKNPSHKFFSMYAQ